MHEMGIISGVIDAVVQAAQEAHAESVTSVTLRIGVMTEAIEDALQFAYEALSEGTMCEGSQLVIDMVQPRSVCLECMEEFEHDRFHRICPACGSYETALVAGRELEIACIDVEVPDEE